MIAGGLAKWKQESRTISTEAPHTPVFRGVPYKSQPNEELVVAWEDVRSYVLLCHDLKD